MFYFFLEGENVWLFSLRFCFFRCFVVGLWTSHWTDIDITLVAGLLMLYLLVVD